MLNIKSFTKKLFCTSTSLNNGMLTFFVCLHKKNQSNGIIFIDYVLFVWCLFTQGTYE